MKSNLNFNAKIAELSSEDIYNEACRCLNCPKPNCKLFCPISNNIPLFISKVKEGKIDEAHSVVMEKSCFPDICSIVCPHEKQCLGHCVRGIKGEPVNIPLIERYIAEHVSYTKPNVTKTNHRFAAIGSGPASLAFALKLAEKGHKVVIYEKENYIGGVLKWGIPSFRLPSDKLDKYINRLKDLGVEFVLNCEIGKTILVEDLLKQYEAIFIGVGAHKSNKIHIPGEDNKNIFNTKEFLSKINLQNGENKVFPECGKNVLVVGGGNAAMDAARSAIRLPQVEKVTIVYRRTEEEMPACHEELTEAKNEGIEFKTLTNPVQFIVINDKINKVECAKMILGEIDSSGRRRPIESNEHHVFIDANTVVLALGFSNDPNFAKSVLKVESDKWGAISVDENNKTSNKRIYAGGDASRGASTVVLAMKDGMNAAKDILKNLEKNLK